MSQDTITFQQIFTASGRETFEREVNKMLMDGWKVVPGTWNVASIERIANDDTPRQMVGPRGTCFLPTYFITLERTERKAT